MAVTDIDERKLEAFVGHVATEIGAAVNAALALIGDELGLYRAMTDGQPVSPAELAARTGTQERYVREWLNAQAASGFVEYGEAGVLLPPEHALVLADEASPFAMTGMFQSANAAIAAARALAERFVTGDGLGWHEHHDGLFYGVERAFAAGYRAHLVRRVAAGARRRRRALEAGGRSPTSAAATARRRPDGAGLPGRRVRRVRLPRRLDRDGARARRRGGRGRPRAFEVAGADDYPGRRLRPRRFFDAFHDIGDPLGAARSAASVARPGGRCMLVEPFAGDRVEDNLNPVGRFYYGMSTLVCTPGSLSQPGRAGLGTQAGEARLSEVLQAGGFGAVRRAAETPLNIVLEARLP